MLTDCLLPYRLLGKSETNQREKELRRRRKILTTKRKGCASVEFNGKSFFLKMFWSDKEGSNTRGGEERRETNWNNEAAMKTESLFWPIRILHLNSMVCPYFIIPMWRCFKFKKKTSAHLFWRGVSSRGKAIANWYHIGGYKVLWYHICGDII